MSGSQECRGSERSSAHEVDEHKVGETNHTTGFSQRKDPVQEFKNDRDALAQYRSLPIVSTDNLENDQHGVCETHADSPSAAKLKIAETQFHEGRIEHPPKAKCSSKSTSEPEREANIVQERATMNDMFKASQEECEILRRRVFELKKNLDNAHDFIFSLQPHEQNLTEIEAAADFNTLCTSVEEFVDKKLGEALDDRTITTKSRVLHEPLKDFLSLIPYPGREAFRYAETDTYNITAAILQLLCNEIFNRAFYCPIGQGERKFITSIEKSMRNLEPRRDLRTCRAWRSETYTAITNRHEFNQFRETRRDILTECLSKMLFIFIPGADRSDLQISVRNTIIDPAFALAHKMHLSVDRFSFEWSQYHDLQHGQRSTFTTEFNEFEFVNLLAGGKMLKTSSSGIVDYIFDITPRLVLRRVKANTYAEPKVLKKAKILVAVTKEGHGRFGDLEARSASNMTVLGWLDERLRTALR